MKTTADLILLSKSNLIIDAGTKTTAEIIQLVGAVGINGNHITIRNVNQKSTADLIQIAGIYAKNVTFDFTD
jgi:hypothetical protein